MSSEQFEFIRELKKQFAFAIAGLFLTIIIGSITFYFTTSANMERIVIEQEELKAAQSTTHQFVIELNEKKINRYEYDRDVDELKATMLRMESKIDLLR
jgi:Na+/melibiose symporter-like transporter